ncbi:OprD family outer membrane porin [Pseudomonas sp. NPDC008258]|uniref:OprD family outer membrane porin n=1 Tax=Pseudomonas sp. NPDC008258 TaxID=3364418 RepID=UPI0036E4DBF3
MNNTSRLVPLTLFLACASPAHAGWLLDNDQVTLGYQNYYWNEQSLDTDEGYPAKSRREWVDAWTFDYFTGKVTKGWALRYGAAFAHDLSISDSADEVSNLPQRHTLTDPGTLAGTRTAYLNYTTPAGPGQLTVGYGKQNRKSHLYTDSDTRILKATSTGVDLTYETSTWKAYYTRFSRYTARNDDGWGDQLENFTGQRIDYVDYYGLELAPTDNLRLMLQSLTAADYLKEHFARLSFSPSFSPTTRLSLTYGQQQDAGHLFETNGLGGYAPAAEHLSTRWSEARVEHAIGGTTLGLAVNQVRGGDYNRVLFHADPGTWEGSGNGWNFYGLEDERTWTADISWNLAAAGIPGLKMQAIAKRSSGARGYQGFGRHELATIISYALQKPFDGLSVMLYLNRHRADGEIDHVERLIPVSGPAQLERKDVVRLYLSWQKTF